MAREETAPPARQGRGRRWLGAVHRELRSHALAYSVVAIFAALGPAVVLWLFPGTTPWVGVFGGLAVGAYAALCGLPDRFYE